MLMDRVNERANGELIIEWIGGPEAIWMFDQGVAVQKRVVDIAWLPSSYYSGLVPETEVLEISQITSDEERQNGACDLINDLHEEVGLFYLGRGIVREGAFYLFTKEKIETPYDLAGWRIGPFSLAEDLFIKLGAVPVFVPRPEAYTAMERGTIDALIVPLVGFTGSAWHEVVNYAIETPVLVQNVVTIVNLDTWSALPKHLQALLTEVAIEVERETPALFAELEEKEWKIIEDAGVERISFSQADAQWFVKEAFRTGWEARLKLLPKNGLTLKELFTK